MVADFLEHFSPLEAGESRVHQEHAHALRGSNAPVCDGAHQHRISDKTVGDEN